VKAEAERVALRNSLTDGWGKDQKKQKEGDKKQGSINRPRNWKSFFGEI
jgi:hypothetical protein